MSQAAVSERHTLRAGAMGSGSLVFTIVATVGPMAAFMGAAPLVFMLNGAAASGTYLLATLLFLVFGVGYLAMARHVGNASGFIVFIASAFGPRAGAAASYVSLLTFPLLLSALYGVYAVFLQQALAEFFGLDVHWAICALATLALIGVLSYNRVEFSARLMGALLVIAVAAMLVLNFAVIFSGAHGNGFSLAGFSPQNMVGAGFGLAALFALGSFGGVESTAVYSEEVRDPKKTIARGTYISILVLGTFYVFSTWVVGNAVGVDNIFQIANEDPTNFIFNVAGDYVGPVWAQLLSVLVVTSFFAVLLGFTNICSRYIFSLGRVGVLPKAIGRTHRKHQSPHVASIVTSVTALVIIGVFLAVGADPFAELYTWLFAIATVGVLSLMASSSAAVVVYFRRNTHRESIWNALIAPTLAFLGFGAAIVLAITNFPALAGEGAVAGWLWVLVPVAAVGGYVIGARRSGAELDFRGVE